MKKFERELAGLKQRIVGMGELARKMVAQALSALFERDAEIVKEVVREEARMDRLQVENDNEAIRLITVYTPVAQDLRFLLMASRINTELERIGDQAVNMGEYVELLLSEPDLESLADLRRMGDIVRGMVNDAMEAFLDSDAQKAEATLKLDDKVDTLNDQVFRDLLTYMMTSRENITRAVASIFVARSLERVADHATNICEEVVYVVKGEDIRHAGPLAIGYDQVKNRVVGAPRPRRS